MSDKKYRSIDGWEPDELWENCEDYTEILSNNSRQLAFAAIAVCWTLKPTSDLHVLPTLLLWAIFFILIFFIFDIAQYVTGTIINRRLASLCEDKKKIDRNFKFIIRKDTYCVTYVFFWGKVMLLLLAYVFIIIHGIRLFFCI
jgi:hypothetical protein